jgi:hypothetical protein
MYNCTSKRHLISMAKYEKKARSLCSFTSMIVMVIFLVLGFCPLRNVLCSLVNPGSPKIAHNVPDHAKIIVHDDCTVTAFNKTLPFYERTFNGNPLIFVVILLTVFFVSNGLLTKDQFLRSKNHRHPPNAIPIYLRNHVLLI